MSDVGNLEHAVDHIGCFSSFHPISTTICVNIITKKRNMTTVVVMGTLIE